MMTVRARLQNGPVMAGLAVLVTVLLSSTIAWASGWPPFAVRDAAVVNRGGTVEELTTGARSVLDNDFDLERDRLTAVLSKNVKRGNLILRPDGTFRYQHDGSKGDEDEFKYRAFDGTEYSREVAVTITIEDVPNSPPFVVSDVPDQTIMEGIEFRLTLAGNFADPDEGDVPERSGEHRLEKPRVDVQAASHDHVLGAAEKDEALRKSEEKYRSLVESAEDFIFTVDESGCFQSLNNFTANFYPTIKSFLIWSLLRK